MIDNLDIAIIGMVGRFPGAKNIDEYWQNLRNGIESITFFNDEELQKLGIEATVLSDPDYIKAKPIIEDIELFDASFFGFNPREAEVIDPQHRLFLESAWEALENAGYANAEGSIGVYGGSSISAYLFNLYSNPDVVESAGQLLIIGNDKDHLSTRVSYKLNLKGPSCTIQTACSTSLVAIHIACQNLLNSECDMALAGGVSINLPHKSGYKYQENDILSPDGHCRAFDAKAEGTVFGSGVGVVVLKRLEDAIADGDCIHAIIKGSAINNDGSLKVSYAAPSVDGQAEVIVEAIANAGVDPDTVTYIETHGTGTSLGDPIEIQALTKAFRASTQNKNFCAIGSVKTNVGHLDRAAGVASIIKTILALKHKEIPPSLHFEEPNPEIDFANSPFYVNTTLSEWKTNGIPHRAGVSSFGIGGTNAHVILEEAPAVKPSDPARPWQLLQLSAKTSTALETATANLLAHLQQHPNLNLADVAYTLSVGRRVFKHRRMVVCQDMEDALKVLTTQDPQRVFTHYEEPRNRSVVFMFSGQGTQYVEMGRELYQSEPIFKQQIDCCSELLKPHLNIDLRHILYPSEVQKQQAAEQLKQTFIAQPALFVIEYALAQLWMASGVRPEAMIGHSIGEYVAATLAGVFSLKDALELVANRGKLMQQLPSGGMLSIQLPQQEVQPLLWQELSLAAINAPSYCVVSGPTAAVEQLQQQLQAKGVGCRRLHTSHAFHSQMMEPIVEPFIQSLQKVKLNSPQIPFISNVTGTWITTAEATDPNYWARHLREPVRFSEGIAELTKAHERVLLEVGPGRTLTTFAKQHWIEELTALTSLPHPQEQQSDAAFFLNTLGRLWLVGVQVDWSGFYAHQRRHRIPLPTYPFERQRYWIEANPKAALATAPQETLEIKPDIADWFYVPRWKESMPLELFQQEEVVKQKSCWLVFVDAYGVGAEIANRLEQYGHDVIIVKIAEQFAQLNDREYTINPQQPGDYNALLEALQVQDLTPQAFAHFWSVTPNATLPSNKSPDEFFEDCQNLGFYSLMFLAKALAERNMTEPIKLMVVTSDVHDVTGDERLCPEKITVLGSCKVIPQEYPNIACYSFDVVLPEFGTTGSQKLIDNLLAEFTAQPTDLIVAYRGHHRWVQTFEAVRLEERITGKTRLRKEGVYLITGGLGKVGLALAEFLAQTVQAKLILLGRKGLPEKNQWCQWLTNHDEQDHVSQQIRRVQALEALGAEVLVISADVVNEQQMQNAIAIATERFGKIHGVIHAAGNLKAVLHSIQQTSKAEVQKQFEPKVYGVFLLDKLFQGKELDFCLLTSSLASVLGGLGFISYTAANLFMDAFVHKHNQITNSCPWFSVNWDDWGIREEQQDTDIEQILPKFFMTPKKGVETFRRVLSMSKVSQVVVSTGDLQARIDQWIKLESLRDTEFSNQANLFSSYQRPNLHTVYVAPRNEVEQTVVNIWQEVLHIQDLGIHDNFFELGGHSLLLIQVHSKMQKIFQRDLSYVEMFQYPTISQMSKYLSQEQSEQLAFSQHSHRTESRTVAVKRQKQARQNHRAAANKKGLPSQ
ncbi:SDR family oxidoreductase [Nostoc edaphicum CCNP1411]|uniref:Phenolphthiocerol/phthiocerol polyketide synthase subunit E n=1 Tax=Nostoc edaphicum CCNP1411 TaxID=1472755 RepID=A0A7D7QMY1_9NOSO|nr:type I polyketide synthase [Nostoc edaphicum]QMS92041.1 SDR family oxidoreductase [Nostoc edaphicum CCNP1411]